MKKTNLFLVLLMALLVMSCTNDETVMSIPQESDAIAFGTYVGRDATTRAAVLNATALQTAGFGVFAFYSDETANEYNATTSNFTPNFMYNTKVSGADWTYSPVKYWPNETNDKLTFFAYAPHSTTANSNISDLSLNNFTGDPTLKFTVNGVAKSQSDLLYADATTDLVNQTKQSVTGKVNFPFMHALSRIGFKVEVMEDVVNDDATGTADGGTVTSNPIESGTVVSVQKVELIGTFTHSNVFNFATGQWSTTSTDITTTSATPAYELNYNSTEANSDFNSVAAGVTIDEQVLNRPNSYLMIIPKDFTTSADKIKIRVTYTVTTDDDALDGDKSIVTNVITSDPFGINFVAGNAYSFNLHLGLTSVKFSATVTDWAEVTTGTVINVPINTTP